MKNIVILGSTGSIGTQTLSVVRENADMTIKGLAAGKNVAALEEEMREFHPEKVCLFDPEAAQRLRERTRDLSIPVLSGMEGLIELAELESADTVLTAVVGMIGIRPTLAAIHAGKDIALANKETLVTAGHLIMPLIQEKGVNLYPVDSEHSAIFQSLEGNRQNKIQKILLTASGGPFRGMTKADLKDVKPEDALKHPNWSMGRKITIDSSTLVNKGLEVMEAKWLFNVPADRIQVVVHPESIIHSMVEYEDGAVIAQMGVPSMKLPIQYALTYPDRRPLEEKKLSFWDISALHFEKPDMEVFPGLRLAYEATRAGGSLPTVYNAANEKAVALFLDGKISYPEIPLMIQEAMAHHKVIENPSVEEILETEKAVYEFLSERRQAWA